MKLNSVILADDSESCDIAELFVMMKNSTIQLLEQYTVAHEDIVSVNNTYLSDSITKQNLSEKMSLVNSEPFLCFWYGHGKADSFRIADEDVVTTTENYYVFSNALIYTFSCLNGNDLADAIMANNAKAFVGYTDYANCPYGIDDVTTEIVTSFISAFLSGKTVNESKADLELSYDNAIYNESLDAFQRQLFQTNRDNLVVKGDGSLVINDILVDTSL
ncbi:MAG: hypothetical protein ILA25_03115 [Prevotella sp.]|nr:hypothetical protein [Prevotella sp.]